ncbi:MAG: flavodoxin family protein [Gammaproteobacteria bacterium]
MSAQQKIIGIVGSYRKEGMIDSAVSEILNEAENQGAEIKKIYLSDLHIDFCTNCRTCMQPPGLQRGACVLEDDMETLLAEIEQTEYLVIGAPININNLNALTRKFIERCIGFAYWPWGKAIPKIRKKQSSKKVVLVSASAAPAWIGRYFSGAMSAFRMLNKLIGAKTIGVLWVGMVNQEHMQLSSKDKSKAQALGRKLLVK